MKNILFLLSLLAFGNACKSDSHHKSAKNCTVMKDGQLTQIEHKYCDKLPESKNYPVRGY
jgi:hypothetical protein